MFNPDLSVVLKDNVSRYSLVTATAKRAREIAVEEQATGETSTEKPVTRALDQILSGEYVIVEPEEIRNI